MSATNAFDNAALTGYIPAMTPTLTMNASSSKCMMEVIQIVSAHTADVLVHIIKIISEKYGHSIPEMMEVVRTHPAFHAIQMHPILTTDFFNIPAVTPVAAAPAAVPVPVLAPKKVTRVVKKKDVNTAVPVTAPVPVPVPVPTPTLSIDRPTTIPSSPQSISPPISPLSQVVVIETPPASTVIDVTTPTAPAPAPVKKPVVVIKKKEVVAASAPAPTPAPEVLPIEPDKKDVKPHTY